jgi:hypothetical protein
METDMFKLTAGLALALAVGLWSPEASVAPPGAGTLGGGDVLETTDNTTTTVVQAQIVEASCSTVTVYVMAHRPSDGLSKCWQLAVGIKRITTGDATLMGFVENVVTPQGDAGAVLWAATLDIDGSLLRVRVTGAASETIEWSAFITGYFVSFTS